MPPPSSRRKLCRWRRKALINTTVSDRYADSRHCKMAAISPFHLSLLSIHGNRLSVSQRSHSRALDRECFGFSQPLFQPLIFTPWTSRVVAQASPPAPRLRAPNRPTPLEDLSSRLVPHHLSFFFPFLFLSVTNLESFLIFRHFSFFSFLHKNHYLKNKKKNIIKFCKNLKRFFKLWIYIQFFGLQFLKLVFDVCTFDYSGEKSI